MKDEYTKAIYLWLQIKVEKEKLRKIESEYDILMESVIPEVWKEYGDGSNWEKDEKYHIGCSQCSDMAISLLIKAKGIE